MFYEIAADGLAKVPALYGLHTQRLAQFHARGVLLMAGPYGNPPVGALAIFTTADAAEEFMSGDPFVLEGVVARRQLQPWDEGLAV